MKHALRALILVLTCCAAGARAIEVKDYFGQWRVSAIVDYANMVAISDAQAKQEIGHLLFMSEKTLTFDHRTCKPKYELSMVDPDKDLETGYQITNETLKLPNPVVLIDTGCKGSRFIYVASPNRLILEKSGVFFAVERNKR